MKKSPEQFRNYAAYVDELREYYSVRIEVRCLSHDPLAHEELHNTLKEYLSNHLVDGTWEVQQVHTYKVVNYVWFTYNEDAVAFMLKYNGKRV